MSERAEQGEIELPEGLVLQDEIDIFQERLTNLSKAKALLAERAKERVEAEKAEYKAKVKEREEKVIMN